MFQFVDLGDVSKVIAIHKKLQHLKSPQGTRDSPARSCLDLHLENRGIKDGGLHLKITEHKQFNAPFQATTGSTPMVAVSVMQLRSSAISPAAR